jgi:hypothetical protein
MRLLVFATIFVLIATFRTTLSLNASDRLGLLHIIGYVVLPFLGTLELQLRVLTANLFSVCVFFVKEHDRFAGQLAIE